MSPPPVLETARLTLRPFVPEDAAELVRVCNDPATAMMDDIEHPFTLDMAKAFIKELCAEPPPGDKCVFAVCLLETGELIGEAGLWELDKVPGRGDLGIIIRRDLWGCGFGTEALHEVIRHAFESLDLQRIDGGCLAPNDRSAAMLRKCGLQFEGRRERSYFRNNEWYDELMFGLLQSDWRENQMRGEGVQEKPDLPRLETERLILRPFAPSDAPTVQKYAADWEFAKSTAMVPHPYPEGAAAEWLAMHASLFREKGQIELAIERRKDRQLIGGISLRPDPGNRSADIGYAIYRPFWGNGYCTEAARAIVSYAFDALGMNRVEAHHFASNPASGRIMQKLGMQYEGTMRQKIIRWGEFIDTVHYAVLKSDYDSRPKE